MPEIDLLYRGFVEEGWSEGAGWGYRKTMEKAMFFGRSVAMAVLLALGACSAPAPYVYTANEFNRDLPTFRKEPADISQVTICYGSAGTTSADVVALAVQECARYGKQARFVRQGRFVCPILTPVSAHYACDPVAAGQSMPVPAIR